MNILCANPGIRLDADLTSRKVAGQRHEQQRPQNAVDGFDGDNKEPDGESPEKEHHADYRSTRSITTDVFALIECFKFAGMWTQVPGCAS